MLSNAVQFTFEIVAAALFSVLKPGKVLDALKHEMYTYTDGLYTSGKKFQEAQRVIQCPSYNTYKLHLNPLTAQV